MNNTENRLLNVPLGNEAHNFAKQNVTGVMSLIPLNQKREIGKQIYLNSLAIYAVNSYLQWLGYETNVKGDFANPLLRSRLNIADLIITGIGNLKCRYLWENETSLIMPNEAIENKIGYVLVQFSEELNQGKLLGFTNELNNNQTIFINELKSLDNLIDYLDRLESANKFLTENDEVAIKVREKLQDTYLTDIIVKLERIYRLENEDEQCYIIKDVLASVEVGIGGVRESFVDDDDFELLELAEKILDKLKEIWE